MVAVSSSLIAAAKALAIRRARAPSAQSKEQYVAKMDDDALFSSLRDKLFKAVVGDVLDKLGWRRQFLPQAIWPLRPDMKIVGRAMPVLEADVFDEGSGSPGLLAASRLGSCWRR
jgi:hypothetical protein